MFSLLGTGPGVHYKSLKTVNQSLKHKVNRCVLSGHQRVKVGLLYYTNSLNRSNRSTLVHGTVRVLGVVDQ